jgi:hypothetical protein
LKRWEAKRYPSTILSNINPRTYDRNQTNYFISDIAQEAPPGLEPSTDWQSWLVLWFKDLQQVCCIDID